METIGAIILGGFFAVCLTKAIIRKVKGDKSATNAIHR